MSSAVLDDYCWIHSTFHVRSEYQGIVGCLVDPELVVESQSRYSDPGYFLQQNNRLGSRGTPDTSFYQWVPFILILQVTLTPLRPLMPSLRPAYSTFRGKYGKPLREV